MVKSLNKSTSMLNFFSSIYNVNSFSKKFNFLSAIVYFAIELVVLALLSALFAFISSPNQVLDQLLVSIIGVPILLFIVYFLFYLFISAFTGESYDFFEGFFVFSIIALHYIIVGNVLTNLTYLVDVGVLLGVLRVLLFLVLIYFVINLVLNLKNYYNSSWQRVVVSFIMVDVIIGLLVVIQYFATLLLQIQGF